MRNQRSDLDDLAALGGLWHGDQGACHQPGSTQAASVTITSTLCDQYVPSFIWAMATNCWDVARRMRVATVALPARAPRRNTPTSRCGFFSLKMAMATT